MRSARTSPRIFYGWWIVGACFVAALYNAGVVSYGFTAIVEPLVTEFGWSYAQISLATSLRGVEVGLGAPLVGWSVDRFGARLVLAIGAAIIGLGLIILGRVNSLLMFYAAYALVSFGTTICGTTAIMAVVAKWFQRKVSTAIGITICGFGSSGLMVQLVVRLVDTYGWRSAITVLGVGMFVITVPLILLVVRNRPEQYGLLPDGATSSNNLKSEDETATETDTSGITARQALKSRTFWHIALIFTFNWMIASAVITHNMPYLNSLRISRGTAGWIASFIPITSIFGRFGFGWLGDRMNRKYLTVTGFTLMSLGMLSFASVTGDNKWLLVLFLLPFGIGFGGLNTMRGVLPRHYFGARSFGTILGFVMEVGIVGSLTGAPLAGLVFDNLGKYQPIWFAFSALAVLAMIVVATIPPVRSPSDAGNSVQLPNQVRTTGEWVADEKL